VTERSGRERRRERKRERDRVGERERVRERERERQKEEIYRLIPPHLFIIKLSGLFRVISFSLPNERETL
jgi:hypothetical protein